MKLALGTAQFGLPYGIANQNGQVDRLAAKAMLLLAATSGIDTVDTAIGYGESEICLGEAGVLGFKVVTKLPAIPAGCVDVGGWVGEQVAGSMARLRVSSLYGVLFHRPEQLLGTEGKRLYQTLQGWKGVGKIQKVGISIYDPSELDVLMQHFQFDMVQAPFNLVDRRLQTTGWLDRLKDLGVQIHTRSAFLQGLLLMPQADIPAKFLPWAPLWAKWHDWLLHHDVSAVQASIAFPLSIREIDRVVVGADSVAQLEQIISATNCALPTDFPNLRCDAEDLINPTRWSRL